MRIDQIDTEFVQVAAIDSRTNVVFGVTLIDTTRPLSLNLRQAARNIMADADVSGRFDANDFVPCHRSTAGCLHIFQIPDSLDVIVGQDPDTIEAVRAGAYLGSVEFQSDCDIHLSSSCAKREH